MTPRSCLYVLYEWKNAFQNLLTQTILDGEFDDEFLQEKKRRLKNTFQSNKWRMEDMFLILN